VYGDLRGILVIGNDTITLAHPFILRVAEFSGYWSDTRNAFCISELSGSRLTI